MIGANKRQRKPTLGGVPLVLFLARLLSVALSGFSFSAAHAADVTCDSYFDVTSTSKDQTQELLPSGVHPTSNTCTVGYIAGEIRSGDYEKFLSLYRSSHPFFDLLLLNSPGGDVDEAMKIGRLLRKYSVTAMAPGRLSPENSVLPHMGNNQPSFLCDGPSCMCASACALIWFGAPDRTGTIGLHRPRTDDPAFKALSPDEAARAYNRMLDRIVIYLNEMETPRSLIDSMISTSSADIQWFDDEPLGIAPTRAPSFAEWLDASCGQFSNKEYEKMIEIRTEKSETPADQLLEKLLSEKFSKKAACESRLVLQQRAKLSPP